MILCIRNTEVIESETAQGVSYPFPPPWGQTVFRPCLSSLHLHFVVLFFGPKWDAVQYNTLGIFAFATTNHQTPTSFIIINRSKTQKEGQSCIIKHTHSVRICACVLYVSHVSHWKNRDLYEPIYPFWEGFHNLSKIKSYKLSSKGDFLLLRKSDLRGFRL